jgi:ATP-dependent Clp protease ATP-binding subunit ClpC
MSIEEMDSKNQETSNKKVPKSKTPFLDNFGKDLTKLALDGKLEQVIGREEEIDRVIQVLSRKKKNNPVLVGSPGVGKTAIVEGIAKKIVEKKVSRVLHNSRVISLDLSSVVAGTKYRGQFEERMKAIIEEIQENPEVIIFIDEIHTIVGAGNSAGSLDASNMLKPALSRGTIQVIGATTIDEYKQSIEKDGAMERRFQKVMVEPTSVEQTKFILNQVKGIYENHHNVIFDDKSLELAVELADRYITSREFPDKAIDIIDEVGARVHIDNIVMPETLLKIEKEIDKTRADKDFHVKRQDYEAAAKARDKERVLLSELELKQIEWEEEESKNKVQISEKDIATVVSKMIGIPVSKITEDEGVKLLNMPNILKEKIVGQDDAVLKVSEAIQISKAGLNNPKKPIASFLFLGSTGTGKTQLSKQLAKYLFNDENALIRLDMSEYQEGHSISKLIGSPPGYVGYEDNTSQLSEKVRNKPYSVVLFDEIEKAHPSISKILLQILDDGILTDGQGRKINFKNTIVIMTSNVGTKELSEHRSMGFTKPDGVDVSEIIEKALKKQFAPEFINRIDNKVVFNKLNEKDIEKIVDIHVNEFVEESLKQEFKITVGPKLKKIIAKDGYSAEFGARPILRMITSLIQKPLAKSVLSGTLKKGGSAQIEWDEKTNDVVVKSKKK